MSRKSSNAVHLHRAKTELERERMVRRVIDKALKQAIEERDEWKRRAGILEHRAEILERERLRLGQVIYDAGLLHHLKSPEELEL